MSKSRIPLKIVVSSCFKTVCEKWDNTRWNPACARFSRSVGDFFTKATALIATMFIICSLCLTVISRQDLIPTTSVIDKIEENAGDEPEIPENND